MSDPHISWSQTGYVFTSFNTAISWLSIKKTMSATSCNHAKILVFHEANQKALTVVHEDNAGCIVQLKDRYIKEDQGRYNDQEMFDTGVLDDEEVIVEKAVAVKEVDAAQDQVSAATTTPAKDLTVDDITLAKALKALITSKLKIIGIVPSEATTTTILIPTQVKEKGKGKMVEPEMPLKKKAQISLDEELAFKLQAEHEEEEERISREKALKANIAEWDDFQAMMDADY
nr:hypothetical protein [Tanacetum cinerariifolium]